MERVLGLATPTHFVTHSGERRGPDEGEATPRRARSGPRGAPRCTRCWSGARRTGGASRRRSWRAATRSPPGSTPDGPTPRSCWSRCGGWLGSPLRERIGAGATRVRAEVPILLGVGGTVLRGSIDLLVEREGDAAAGRRLQDRPPRRRRARPSAPAATRSSARSTRWPSPRRSDATEVEVAYVFLERPEEPVAHRPRPGGDGGRPRPRWSETIAQIGRGEFPVAPPEERDWALCRGCPALRGLCSGPEAELRLTSEAVLQFRRELVEAQLLQAPRRPRPARRRSR